MEKRDSFFERFFGISQSGSTMKIEVLAGITTFITIAYILILNPQILADPYVIMGDTVMAGKIPMVYLLVLVLVHSLEQYYVRCMLRFHLHRLQEWD